jgi:uncharacterized protein (TIGR00266 family)
MHQWFLSYGGQQRGPLDQASAAAQAAANPNGHCWRQGFPEWIPIAACAELRPDAASGAMLLPGAPPALATQRSDVVDYRIFGEEMQFVEVELDPGESAVAEAGSLMYKDAAVRMETVFGDGSHASSTGSFMDKLVGAGKRVVTGEGLFTTVFSNGGGGKSKVAFAAPYPGTILPMTLSNYGGKIIAQKDSFLCAARGVSIGVHFQKKVMTALFGGEGFIMQKLEGDGLVFIHAGGTVVERELRAGERLDVDTGCVVAFTSGVNFDVQSVGSVKSILFGGEGVFLATLTGPGKVWLQSLPFSRLAGRMFSAAYQRGGSRGEGSVLGGLGGIISGDRGF